MGLKTNACLQFLLTNVFSAASDKPHPYTRFRSAISKKLENQLSASERHTLSNPQAKRARRVQLGDQPLAGRGPCGRPL